MRLKADLQVANLCTFYFGLFSFTLFLWICFQNGKLQVNTHPSETTSFTFIHSFMLCVLFRFVVGIFIGTFILIVSYFFVVEELMTDIT